MFFSRRFGLAKEVCYLDMAKEEEGMSSKDVWWYKSRRSWSEMKYTVVSPQYHWTDVVTQRQDRVELLFLERVVVTFLTLLLWAIRIIRNQKNCPWIISEGFGEWKRGGGSMNYLDNVTVTIQSRLILRGFLLIPTAFTKPFISLANTGSNDCLFYTTFLLSFVSLFLLNVKLIMS